MTVDLTAVLCVLAMCGSCLVGWRWYLTHRASEFLDKSTEKLIRTDMLEHSNHALRSVTELTRIVGAHEQKLTHIQNRMGH